MSIALSSSATQRGIIARGIPVYPDPENVGREQRIRLIEQREAERKEAELRRHREKNARIRAHLQAIRIETENAIARARGDSIERIIRRICTATGVTRLEIMAENRTRPVIMARHAIMYWARRRTHLSLPQIGRLLGGRDHSTVLHAVQTYKRRRAEMGRTLREVR